MIDAEQIENWQHGTQISGHERGPWSQTASGRRFHPLNPDLEAITLEDIAHQLSMVSRFGGATKYPYSVAQHTLLCLILARSIFPGRKTLRKWALLHDAPEYVLGDMVRPVKVLLPEYSVLEDRLMIAIAMRFGLPEMVGTDKADLKYIDNLACVIEKHFLLPNSTTWQDMPTYVPGFDYWVMERSWRAVKRDLLLELKQEFPNA